MVLLDRERLDDEWPRCAAYLEPALDGCSLGDVYRALEDERARLWPLERSAVVTEIVQYPRLRACRVWLAGGDLDELRRNLPTLDEYARACGCDRIEIDARKGWQRVLTGYELTRVVLTKEL